MLSGREYHHQLSLFNPYSVLFQNLQLSERMKLMVQRENQRALASALRLSEQMMNHENQRAPEHLELLKVSWRYT